MTHHSLLEPSGLVQCRDLPVRAADKVTVRARLARQAVVPVPADTDDLPFLERLRHAVVARFHHLCFQCLALCLE